ncbi:DEAD/DEAH box helicase [bacterium]|nr:DEAD/DEAH box helicase [bacterium]
MATSKKSSSVLNILYEHLDPFDWEEGIDLYQSGKVKKIQNYTGLISAKVENFGPRGFDSRLKFHPNGKVIQWFECSCLKNRKSGALCEHLIALMVHIDREIPKMFANLDKKMPIKLPTIRKKAVKKSALEQASEPEVTPQRPSTSNPFMSFVEKGNLLSVSMAKTPGKLSVKFEIKSGTTDSFELDIDDSSQMVASNKYSDLFKGNAKKLAFHPHIAFPAIVINEKADAVFTLDRVIAIKIPDGVQEKISSESKIKFTLEKLSEYNREENTELTYLTLPYKKLENHFGKETLFIPGVGYFKYDTSKVSGNWFDMPYSKKLKENDAGALVEDGFSSLLDASTVLGPAALKDDSVVTPELTKIDVKKNDGSWFFLDPQYGTGDYSISMMELVKHAREKKKKYIQNKGKWFKIPDAISNYDWDLDQDEDLLKLDAIGLLRFKASIGEFDSAEGSKEVITNLQNSIEFKRDSTPPDLSHTELNLREYQTEGLNWLWWLYQNNLHGLLADDMGLGKTHQSMALLSSIQAQPQFKGKSERDQPKFLVICPTTVLEHWEDKIMEFSPGLKPLKYHGPKRRLAYDYLEQNNHTLITSYGILLRDIKILSKMNWEAVILDEAHFVKNSGTATYKAVCKINSTIRVCLTGTPIENELSELKTLYDFMVPGYLGSDDYFKKQFLKPLADEESDESKDKHVQLKKLIHPLKMRRTKKEVLKDLPDKIEDLRHCMLSDEQVALYRDTVELKSAPIIDQLESGDTPIPYMHVFATLQLLKQICNHPSLVTGKSWKLHESGKFELFKELLNEAFGSGHKVVIFSQYVGMINIISEYLKSLDTNHVVLTGGTRNRGALIDKFQTDPNCKVFIGSLLAGGIGIDLTAASVVIHYDRWWNASKENQATDRVHRIGQKRSVQVIKMVTKGTLEEKIDQMINNKKKLFEKFMEKDEELFKNLSKQELIQLLSG